MKKTHILFAALFSSLAFAGCNFDELQTPKEIKVRTDATYEFSVMSFDSEKEGSKLKLSDYFDLSKTLEEKTSESADSKDMKVYKYNDGSQFQQFLIHMPLDEVDFDFGESFKDMDFSKSMENFNMKKEIEIPVIETPEKEEPIDLSDVSRQLNNGVKFGGVTGSHVSPVFGTIPGKLDFTSVEYSSGNLIITGNSETITGTVDLYDGTDPNPKASATFNNGQATINLTDITISKTGLYLVFSDTAVKQFGAQVQEDSKIKTATGVTLTGEYAPVVTPSNITFPFSLSSDVKSCEITDGSLTVQIKRPSGWASVITAYTINLSGGLEETFTQSKTTETYYYTDDSHKNTKTLSNGDIIANPSITVVINDASLDFENGPSVYAKVEINKISATVVLSEGYETNIQKDEPVSNDLKKNVERIYWDPSGFDVEVVNELPAENDITLDFVSSFFAMASNPQTILGGTVTPTTKNYRGGTTITKFVDSGEGNKFEQIDVEGTITLPGYNSTENTITVKNVEPGEKYKLDLTVKPAFNWTKADVKAAEESNLKDVMNTGINNNSLFEAMGKDFAEKVKLRTMPLYICGSFPNDIFGDDTYYVGNVKTYYGTGSGESIVKIGENPVYVIGDSAGTYARIITNDLPTLTPNEAGEITTLTLTQAGDFAPSMNVVSENGTLCVDYDIRINSSSGSGTGTIPITPETINNSSGPTKIKIDLIMLMTMDFNVTDPVDIDMLAFANKKDGDLLGRSEATEASKYLDVIKSATISIEKFMLPMTGDISLSIDSKGDGTDVVKKAVGNGETYSIEVNPKEMLSTYPYSPNIKFVLEKGNFGILRTMPISGKIKLRVKAKGDIPIFSFAEQE